MKDYEFLKIGSAESICTLTISAPKSLNALNSSILKEMDDFLSNLDPDIRVLIITGDGEKSFVAGADISEMQPLGPEEGEHFGAFGASVFRKIETLPIPVIAAVNGFALGGGCELALACDIRLASNRAKFGQPEVGLGIIPGFSGTYRLAKIAGMGVAKELIFSGRAIKADEALATGNYAADLRFGHDYPLMALASYLGVEGVGDRLEVEEICEKWFGFWNICMASNLQLIFYKNKAGHVLVKFLYQEQERKLRGLEPVVGPYYDWETVKANLEGYKR